MAFRVCLIGCGGMAQNGHGPMLKKYASMNPDVELTACCDISRERAEAFAVEFGFDRWFVSMDDMMDSARPDGVLLAVPVELRAGGALFFAGMLPHMTPPNTSPDRRRALQFHYRSATSQIVNQAEYDRVYAEADGTPASCAAAPPKK